MKLTTQENKILQWLADGKWHSHASRPKNLSEYAVKFCADSGYIEVRGENWAREYRLLKFDK